MATASSSRTRCATASSRTCCSCSRMAAGWPRSRRAREGGLTTLTRAAYTPCAVIDENGCPQQSDLADQRRPGRPRSGAAPHHLSGREPQPVRHADHRLARPVPSRRQPGRRQRLARPRHSLQPPQRPRARRALLSPARAESRRDGHAARLFRGAADARSRVSAADLARRLPGPRLSSPMAIAVPIDPSLPPSLVER